VKGRFFLSRLLSLLLLLLTLFSHPAASTRVVFNDIGGLAGAVSYGHVVIPITVKPTAEQVLLLRSQLEERYYKAVQRLPTRKDPDSKFALNISVANDLAHARLTATHIEETDLLFDRLDTLRMYFPADFQALSLPGPFVSTVNLTERLLNFTELEPSEAWSPPMFSRSRRGLPLLGLASFAPKFISGAFSVANSLFSTINGLYTRSQIKQLRQDVGQLLVGQKRVYKLSTANTAAIVVLKTQLLRIEYGVAAALADSPAIADANVDLIIKGLHRALDVIVQAVQQAKLNKLSTEFLAPEVLEEAYANIKDMAKANQCDMVLDQAADLEHAEVSYIADHEGAVLLLHVPMVPAAANLRLLRLQPFPIPLGNQTALMPELITDVIGISTDGLGFTAELRYPDLLECHKIGRTHYCDRQSVIRKDSQTCLTALHDKKFDLALELCTFTLVPLQEYAIPMGNNQFLIYSPSSIAGEQNCATISRAATLDIPRGISTLTVRAGCVAILQKSKIYADNSVYIEAKHFNYNWDWTSSIYALNHHAEAYEQLAAKLHHNPGPLHLRDVLREADALHQEIIEKEEFSAATLAAAQTRSLNTLIASIAAATALAAVFGLGFTFIHYRRKYQAFDKKVRFVLRHASKLMPNFSGGLYPDLPSSFRQPLADFSNFLRTQGERLHLLPSAVQLESLNTQSKV